ncbi:membrane protein [Cellulomonas chitinilytica]|uniref:Membrane protein n=1 Tax=Cellulomonas chitinilytica TaxID=398759 RepID=A0A919U2E1_9CELL|nr:vitamin K epoxide reductase family protein [Cellulomonas chitinilytica]GIG22266.1 membrane protein [Cellulomonas chitinilytica]
MTDAATPTSRGSDPDVDALDPDDGYEDDLDLVDDDPDLLQPAPLVWRRRTAIEMAISGVIGLYTSFVLSIEAIALAKDPESTFGCDLNSVISCAEVASRWQAQLFGWPNAFLGIAAEAVVITVAVAMIGGVTFPRWFMLAAETIYTAGLIFALWLFYEAWAVIGALCPWCLLITLTTTVVWAGLTRICIRDGHLFPGPRGAPLRRFVASGNDWFVTIAFLVVIAILVVAKYGSSLLS